MTGTHSTQMSLVATWNMAPIVAQATWDKLRWPILDRTRDTSFTSRRRLKWRVLFVSNKCLSASDTRGTSAPLVCLQHTNDTQVVGCLGLDTVYAICGKLLIILFSKSTAASPLPSGTSILQRSRFRGIATVIQVNFLQKLAMFLKIQTRL